ncbi:ubiquitin-2 like Rad60 SUMO-like-domain-containing protein [Diplogelasinospora grovesii]|uniref:Ubiquitin-2 like Rad60 SUMO-like-domain-containing protein n=1 Tax=Diplogelasinospora grovesii TaxID=303347 RepID=A0AAN6NFL6_9PEZI|nr:ubiquitin-2 like Rad60 SUMO-like-domain-containing protein [Diplogelasinospora grovesii]
MTVTNREAAIAPLPTQRTRPLPFKRTTARRRSPQPTAGAQLGEGDINKTEKDDNALDFFRRKDVFSQVIQESELRLKERKEKEEVRLSTEPAPAVKRRKVSREEDGKGLALKRSSSPTLLDEPIKVKKSSTPAPLDLDDDDVKKDVKGKGKEIIRSPKKERFSRGTLQSKTAVSSKIYNPPIVQLDDSEDDMNDVRTFSSQRSRQKREESPIEIVKDEEAVKVDDSDEEKSKLQEVQEVDEWVIKARELAKKNQEVVINILLTSAIPDTAPLMVKRKLSQTMELVLRTWVDLQKTRHFHITDEEASKLFLTWKGNKIYPTTTPASLGVGVDSEGEMKNPGGAGYRKGGLHLEIWTEELFLEHQKAQERERALQLGLVDDADLLEFETGQGEQIQPQKKKRKGIKVILKAKALEPLPITVKEDTVVATMIEAFRRQRHLQPDQQVAIWFDGERLDDDSLVTDADIDPDDTNQLEVHIK